MDRIALFWFRRDLRLHDNHGLYQALKSGLPVLPLFIFDTTLLSQLPDRVDARVGFIHQTLSYIKKQLEVHGSSLLIRTGIPVEIFKKIIREYPVGEVYTNHDYEPYALERDNRVADLLNQHNIAFHTFKDQLIFEKNEILKDDGTPYTVFTPYSKKWIRTFKESSLPTYPSEKLFSRLTRTEPLRNIKLEEIGFKPSQMPIPETQPDRELIKNYDKNRNFPGFRSTTRLGIHLRFGTISLRRLIRTASKLNATFLNELIWREFYMAILWHFPHVVDQPFKPAYANINWRNNEKEFKKWCLGQTGYPIVDAGMRELNATGFMHNRARMITASFLTKHLLIDWRWGEQYFADKLLDYELSSNNGGWQWASGSGCDAAPYFRIFNPWLQTKKFDPDLKYIRKWIPEFNTPDYPQPIVEHSGARERALQAYKKALDASKT